MGGRDRIFEALEDKDASVRQTAVGLIAGHRGNWLYDQRALEPLLLAAHSDYADRRYVSNAVKSLRRYKDPRVTEALLYILKTSVDSNDQVAAVEVLRARKELRAVEPLIEALKTQSENYVADSMFLTLAELGDKRALPVMAAYLTNKHNYQLCDAFEKIAGQSYQEYEATHEQNQPR